MKNKIIAHLSIILILSGVFCNVCTSYNRLSFYDNSVYAEADNWSTCDTSDLVTAFRYYCKSRNLSLEGSYADALTGFTTTTFNNLCSTLGIDPTSLSAELKKTTEGNLGLRFLFSNTGITAYNRIFAEFLQNNDLSVGDSVDNEVIFSGDVFTDDNGNSCYIYELTSSISPTNEKAYSKDNILKYGTPLVYTSESLFNSMSVGQIFNASFTYKGVEYKGNKTSVSGASNGLGFGKFEANFNNVQQTCISYHDRYYAMYVTGVDFSSVYGHCCVFKIGNNYYIGSNRFNNKYASVDNTVCNFKGVQLQNPETNPSDITVNTPNNTVINNNTYNNNYVIIYNGGDTYISDDDDEPLPTTPPDGGGGGGGGDNPDNPDFPPVDPTPTPEPKIPDWDIELPEMPTGNDWLLYGLEKKFPWDIPFNLMYMLSLFAADPETPHFEGTLDLKIVQWNYDIDLSPFDDIAEKFRMFEFIGFLLGLMLLTRRLIWG